jgi:hypothetical protein
MEVSGKLHALAALPTVRTPLPIEQQAQYAPEPVWMFWRREDLLPLQVSKPQIIQHIAQFLYQLSQPSSLLTRVNLILTLHTLNYKFHNFKKK